MMRKDRSKALVAAVLFAAFMASLVVVDIRYSRADSETIQTTTTTTQTGNGGNFKTVEVEKSRTTERPVRKQESPGLVGSFFGFLGNVIAFPFRVIGGVLKAIF